MRSASMAPVSVPARSRAGDPPRGRQPASLAEPFGDGDLAWTVVEIGDGGDEVRVTPRVAVAALHGRLDAVCGVRGWSVSYTPMSGDAVACHLVIDGVTKGIVAAPALVGGAEVTAAIAFAQAAARFGAVPPWPPEASAWVACDPETYEPLHAPALAGPERGAAGGSLGDPIEGGARDGVRDRAPDSAPNAASAVAAVGDEAAAANPVAGGATLGPTPASAKPAGQQMIDRLIERLKAQGQGLAAARILVRHGGYGKDPQAARELYAELRQLLLGAAADAEPAAPAAAAAPEVAARETGA
jgi:hypothetical protein